MKNGLCFAAFLVLAAQLPLWGYDSSPSATQIIPEAIWAAATGGGTWVTEVQITSFDAGPTDIFVYFFSQEEYQGPFKVCSGLVQFNSVRFSNILAEIDAQDSNPTVYFSKVAALWFFTLNHRIQVQAKTVNGNYGKVFPGLNPTEGNTAAEGRSMIIQDLVQNATYRTFVGVHNPDFAQCSVTFTIIDAHNVVVGSPFTRPLTSYCHLTFNPFAKAGVPSGTYENCWLLITVDSGGQEIRGVMCFGSIANNYTNDTYALLAKQYGTGSTAAPELPIR